MLKMLSILSLVLSFSVAASAKGNAAKGKAAAVTCIACHGANGIGVTPMWPNLNGQKAAYLVKQLKDFKSGARKDPSMGPMAKPLTPAQMEDIAAYYSSLK